MTTSQAYSVRVFVPSGQPDDLFIIEKSNWTGVGFAFPRANFAKARSRSELDQPGVYVLWGHDEDELRPKVYVGMSDRTSQRISNHISRQDREFWQHTVAFTSKDGNFNGSHARYVESRLISLATEAGRCELQNSQEPSAPNLSEADKADAESFLQDVLLCLPLVSANFFAELQQKHGRQQTTDATLSTEPSQPDQVTEDQNLLYLRIGSGDRETDSTGYVNGSEFVVLAGSKAAKSAASSASATIVRRREDLMNRGVLEDQGTHYLLTKDTPFDTPSTASSTMRGSNSNGRIDWKNSAGKTLSEVEQDLVSNQP